MLHKKRVLNSIYHACRGRLRKGLGLAPRKRPPPVLSQDLEHVLERHGWILRSIEKHSPPGLDLKGKKVCEVGAGDCLASSSHFLARGATHVDIIEVHPPVVIEKQVEVLKRLQADGHAIDLSMIQTGDTPRLDEKRVSYHRCYMEQFQSVDAHQFIFSFSVVEHVEDLAGFYASCFRTLHPGGWMLHMVDLGGHEAFEDPLPPLDFQVYPIWLFTCMYPKYRRATRRFLNEHLDAIRTPGFVIEKVTPTRVADEEYLDRLWPHLRKEARMRPREELGVVEFAVLARKP